MAISSSILKANSNVLDTCVYNLFYFDLILTHKTLNNPLRNLTELYPKMEFILTGRWVREGDKNIES